METGISLHQLYQIAAAGVVFVIGWLIKSPLFKNVPSRILAFLGGLDANMLSKLLDVLGTVRGRGYLKTCILAYKEEMTP